MLGLGKKKWFVKKTMLSKEPMKMRLKFLWSAFKWKRLTSLPVSFMDNVLFKLLSAFEAILLVLTLCFFYLCCGCNF